MKVQPAKVITITKAETVKTVMLPVQSAQPSAGFPSPGDDYVERALDLNELLIDDVDATYYVRVSGDSMEGVKIFDGDILVVDRSVEARSGMVVVAAVNGELVVKKLVKVQARYELHSENSHYEPIILGDDDNCTIWGVVTGSVRVFK